MGFTKLDERILQSSIMAESAVTFKIWITLLAACRANGIAYVSAVYLSSICHLPLCRVEAALARLESPDEHSRSLTDDGRRIRRVDGGYEIINYTIYRDISLKDAEAERKRLYRKRIKGGCPDNAGRSPDTSASASASEDLTKKIEEIKRGWNEFAAKHNLATITKIDPKSERGRHLAARMAEKDWNFPKLLNAVAESPFLLGKKGKEPFFVTFDWLLWPGNYQRTMEGNYKERRQSLDEWAKGEEK
jgi:hypothetical protein